MLDSDFDISTKLAVHDSILMQKFIPILKICWVLVFWFIIKHFCSTGSVVGFILGWLNHWRILWCVINTFDVNPYFCISVQLVWEIHHREGDLLWLVLIYRPKWHHLGGQRLLKSLMKSCTSQSAKIWKLVNQPFYGLSRTQEEKEYACFMFISQHKPYPYVSPFELSFL